MFATCKGVTPSLLSCNPNASRTNKRPIQLTLTDIHMTRTTGSHDDKPNCVLIRWIWYRHLHLLVQLKRKNKSISYSFSIPNLLSTILCPFNHLQSEQNIQHQYTETPKIKLTKDNMISYNAQIHNIPKTKIQNESQHYKDQWYEGISFVEVITKKYLKIR